jgi:hypothetical protein
MIQAYRILVKTFYTSRKFGKLKVRKEDDIKMDLKGIVCTYDD